MPPTYTTIDPTPQPSTAIPRRQKRGQRRACRKVVRLSATELAMLTDRARACRLPMSHYLRVMALGRRLSPRRETPLAFHLPLVDRAVLRLREMARDTAATGDVVSTRRFEAAAQELAEVLTRLAGLRTA